MQECTVSSSTVSLTAAVAARGGSNVWLHNGQQGSSTSTPKMRKLCSLWIQCSGTYREQPCFTANSNAIRLKKDGKIYGYLTSEQLALLNLSMFLHVKLHDNKTCLKKIKFAIEIIIFLKMVSVNFYCISVQYFPYQSFCKQGIFFSESHALKYPNYKSRHKYLKLLCTSEKRLLLLYQTNPNEKYFRRLVNH